MLRASKSAASSAQDCEECGGCWAYFITVRTAACLSEVTVLRSRHAWETAGLTLSTLQGHSSCWTSSRGQTRSLVSDSKVTEEEPFPGLSKVPVSLWLDTAVKEDELLSY